MSKHVSWNATVEITRCKVIYRCKWQLFVMDYDFLRRSLDSKLTISGEHLESWAGLSKLWNEQLSGISTNMQSIATSCQVGRIQYFMYHVYITCVYVCCIYIYIYCIAIYCYIHTCILHIYTYEEIQASVPVENGIPSAKSGQQKENPSHG